MFICRAGGRPKSVAPAVPAGLELTPGERVGGHWAGPTDTDCLSSVCWHRTRYGTEPVRGGAGRKGRMKPAPTVAARPFWDVACTSGA